MRPKLVILAVAVAAVALVAASESWGAQPSRRAFLGPVVGGHVESGPQMIPVRTSPKSVRAFWTPERMARARPITNNPQEESTPPSYSQLTSLQPGAAAKPDSPSGRQTLTTPPDPNAALKSPFEAPVGQRPTIHGDDPGSTSTEATEPAAAYADGFLGAASYPSSVGRLYYSTPEGLKVCTATTVGPNLILTAAHCVTSLSGVNHTNFLFVPQQYGTSYQYGTWTVRGVSRWNSYWQVRDPDNANLGFGPLDYAFLIMDTNGGQTIGSVTSWWSILINPPTFARVFHEGYPGNGGGLNAWCPNAANAWWSCFIWYCDTTISSYRQVYGWWEAIAPCRTGGGSSGGPWFQQKDGGWYIGSDESKGTQELGTVPSNWGATQIVPYYNDWLLTLYNEASRF